MAPRIKDFKVFVPAKDFERSKRFYSALGFSISEGWGDTADFELDGHQFRLQNYYVEDWANNFMIKIGIDDVDAWHQHVRSVAGQLERVRIKPPERVDGFLVLHVVDPSGVLLVFVQDLRYRPGRLNGKKPAPGSAFRASSSRGPSRRFFTKRAALCRPLKRFRAGLVELADADDDF